MNPVSDFHSLTKQAVWAASNALKAADKACLLAFLHGYPPQTEHIFHGPGVRGKVRVQDTRVVFLSVTVLGNTFTVVPGSGWYAGDEHAKNYMQAGILGATAAAPEYLSYIQCYLSGAACTV
jgi:hypothetical protein